MNASPVQRWAIVVAAGSALVLAWHAAVDGALIVSPPPGFVPGMASDDAFAAHFAWLRGIAFHDLGVRVVAAATFLALAGLGRSLTVMDGGQGADARPGAPATATAGRLLVVAGLFGAMAQLIELGGHDAAIAASGSQAPATAVSMDMFFIDQVGAAIAAATWAIFGAGALIVALAAGGRMAIPGFVLGTALVVLAGSWLFDDPAGIADGLLTVTGLVLIPTWALTLDRRPAGARQVVVGGLGTLLVLGLLGCGDAPSSPTGLATAPVEPVAERTAEGATSPSPSPAPAAAPDRVVFHRGGLEIGSPPVDLANAAANVFDTGIEAIEPTIEVLADGAIAYQGWDRPPSGAVGTSHVHVAGAAGGPWRDVSPVPPGPTHDPYLAVDPRTGRILSAALLAPGELEEDRFCIVVSFTDDRGATWDTSHPVCTVDADRPRLIASTPVTSDTGGASLLTLCYVNARADGQVCLRSTDGGASFQPSGSIPPDGCDPGPSGPLFGHLATDRRGTLYLGRISCRQPVVAISADEGTTWTEHVIGPEGWNGYPEVAVAVDADGVIYAAWISTDRLPYLVASEDAGATWTAPIPVAAPGVTEANLLVLEAGSGGRVAIGALVSTDAPAGVKPAVAVECRDGPCTDAVFYERVTWHASLTLTTDARAEAPTFVTAILNDPAEPIVRGACGPGRCKSNADFTDLVIDARGQPWLAFVACPDGQCPTRSTGGYWGSSAGMLGTIEGVTLR